MQYCSYCGFHRSDTTIHPLNKQIICRQCYLQEISYRTRQLSSWVSSTRHKPFEKQIIGLDKIEQHSRNLVKQMTYRSLVERLRSMDSQQRFDGQEGMV